MSVWVVENDRDRLTFSFVAILSNSSCRCYNNTNQSLLRSTELLPLFFFDGLLGNTKAPPPFLTLPSPNKEAAQTSVRKLSLVSLPSKPLPSFFPFLYWVSNRELFSFFPCCCCCCCCFGFVLCWAKWKWRMWRGFKKVAFFFSLLWFLLLGKLVLLRFSLFFFFLKFFLCENWKCLCYVRLELCMRFYTYGLHKRCFFFCLIFCFKSDEYAGFDLIPLYSQVGLVRESCQSWKNSSYLLQSHFCSLEALIGYYPQTRSHINVLVEYHFLYYYVGTSKCGNG